MVRFILYLILFFNVSLLSVAQTRITKKGKKLAKDIQNKSTFLSMKVKKPHRLLGLYGQMNTNGYGLGIFFEKKISKKKYRHMHLFLSEVKADKEEKFKPTNLEIKPFEKPKPYIYGKRNSFYTVNLNYGQRHLIYEGLFSPAIDISFSYYGGITLGLLKPYALKLKHPEGLGYNIQEEVYSSLNQDTFLDKTSIYSRAAFSYSLNDLKFVPGATLGCSFEAELGKQALITKRLFIGSSISVYSSSFNLMVDDNSRRFLYNAFVGMRIGKWW